MSTEEKKSNNERSKRYKERQKEKNKNLQNIDFSKIMRKCTGTCKQEKSLTEFCSDKSSLYGKSYICKDCKFQRNNSNADRLKKENINPETFYQPCNGPLCNGKEYPLINFTKNKGCKYGYAYECMSCRKVIRRKNVNISPKTIGKKICTNCKINHDVKNFYTDKYSIDGLQTTCKKCHIKRHAISYSKLEVFLRKIKMRVIDVKEIQK